MSDEYWITREGKRILISEMTDQHLVNTIQMLDRWKGEFLIACEGETDEYYMEDDYTYRLLVREYIRRKNKHH
jgi:hypothetical protein